MKITQQAGVVAVVLAVGWLAYSLGGRRSAVDPFAPPNGQGQLPAFPGQTRAPEATSEVDVDVVTVARGLEHPWGLTFLPDGRMLVTEQPGRLRIVGLDGALSAPVAGLPDVDARGQGGLLDVEIDVAYPANRLIYWSYAEAARGGGNHTALARGRLVDGEAPRVENVRVLYRQSPSLDSTLHYGGRIVFGSDGTLYLTQGERSIPEGRMQAQRLDGLLGKIVRLNPDGSIPRNNPFIDRTDARDEIWSSGHRNVQAAAVHPETGELWAVEHGTRGGDELNVARAGRDYGWPTIAYGIEYGGGPITGGIQAQDGLEQPLYYWDPVIAPSGMTFYTGTLFPAWQGNLFIGGLASRALVRLVLDGERVAGEERLLTRLDGEGERIRDVVQGRDGALYLLTDNSAGRILKVVPRED